MKDEKALSQIIVFADGACTGNPGPGGWGAIIATPDGHVTELGGASRETTNNRMEITAAGRALRAIESLSGIVHLHTDSVYVINGITKWIWGWQKRGWKTAEGGEVANVEFWKRLGAIVAKRRADFGDEGRIEWKYVRGHIGVPGNERADEIAASFARGKHVQLYDGPLLKYGVAIHDLPEDCTVPDRTRNSAAAKKPAYSYLSMVGGKIERHATWDECSRRVKGVSGAKFKKCMSAEEEEKLRSQWGG